MIVLDTNVLSAVLVEWEAEPSVLTWVRKQREQPVTTALNRAELLSGVALMPEGRKRELLADAVTRRMSDLRLVLPFTTDCAAAFAEIVAVRTRAGRPIGTMDALIAAIAVVNGASIATRDVDGFSGIGLTVHNPWSDLA